MISDHNKIKKSLRAEERALFYKKLLGLSVFNKNFFHKKAQSLENIKATTNISTETFQKDPEERAFLSATMKKYKNIYGLFSKRNKAEGNGMTLNKKGQSLVEYLILVALMGVATIGIIRTLNQTVKSRFANAIYALQGRSQKARTHTIKKEEYQRSDLSDFMSGSSSKDTKNKK